MRQSYWSQNDCSTPCVLGLGGPNGGTTAFYKRCKYVIFLYVHLSFTYTCDIHIYMHVGLHTHSHPQTIIHVITHIHVVADSDAETHMSFRLYITVCKPFLQPVTLVAGMSMLSVSSVTSYVFSSDCRYRVHLMTLTGTKARVFIRLYGSLATCPWRRVPLSRIPSNT